MARSDYVVQLPRFDSLMVHGTLSQLGSLAQCGTHVFYDSLRWDGTLPHNDSLLQSGTLPLIGSLAFSGTRYVIDSFSLIGTLARHDSLF